ncbi:MAG: hypothetical protein CM1200mP22_34050 [Dehalococcoidia bacterium]|nr:MAG: hypothetical protein CM1200mP22_34050 [Dehalococcoidia bacterium]
MATRSIRLLGKVSDGGAAAIITTPEIAQSFRQDYILVKGLGLSVGAFGMIRDDWDFTHFPESVHASQSAYQGKQVSLIRCRI